METTRVDNEVTMESELETVPAATLTQPPRTSTGIASGSPARKFLRIVFDRIPDGLVLRPGMNVDVTIYTK
jgi:hypothetical protein